jgi:type VI secretion system protein VasG
MTEINRAALFGKLNPVGYRSIEGATVFCKLRGNPYVELVHWLHQILQAPDSDLHRIIRHFDIDPSRLSADLTAALGVCNVDVLRHAGTHRSSSGRHDQDAQFA